jgi:ethanolamine utilization microcompartment shell protein EutS
MALSRVWVTIDGFELVIGFIDHFNTRLVTTLNYSAIADLQNLQISTAHAKYFQFAMCSPVVSW